MQERGVIGKRGLSTVVTTVIMVLLVLVAISVVWVVINNILGDTASDISITKKCTETNLIIDSATFLGTSGSVSVSNSGIHAINGTLITWSSATDSEDIPAKVGDIQVTKIFTDTLTLTPTKVSVKAYFIDEEGVRKACSRVVESVVT